VIALIYQSNLIKGSHDFTENLSDGHTLDDQLVRATIVKQSTGVTLIYDYSCLYFRGTDNDNSAIGTRHRGKEKKACRDPHGTAQTTADDWADYRPPDSRSLP
jgi:hypothetical protein